MKRENGRRRVTHVARSTVKHVLRALTYSFAGGLVMLLIIVVLYLEKKPDLSLWHTVVLDEEFTASSRVKDFEGYLELEDRLFAQVDKLVYDRIQEADDDVLSRYMRGSLSDASRWPGQWNRSYELRVDQPRAGVLLIHGLSDSPYSLHSLGESLHDEGAWVVGLRVPGHGTAPSGLLRVEWEDMAGAVELAMRHLKERVPEGPLYLVGYSNGGALSVLYSLLALTDETLPMAQGVVLLSPEIGISKAAAMAGFMERLGRVFGFKKLAWTVAQSEYDPYKYISFTLNAGKQSYELTQEIQSRITELAPTGTLSRMPAILAFQSIVDNTVSAPVLVSGLMGRLPEGGHELVVFDINRNARVRYLLSGNPSEWLEVVLKDTEQPFAITVVSNESAETAEVVSRTRRAGDAAVAVRNLGMAWPDDLYSLSHVSLPFASDDPVYGGHVKEQGPGIRLGDVAYRGELGVLQVSGASMLRLRWNPFYTYLENRVLEFVQ